MEDIAIVAIIAIIVGLACFYLYKAKKSGKKCVGCPDGGCCEKNGTGPCCCGDKSDK